VILHYLVLIVHFVAVILGVGSVGALAFLVGAPLTERRLLLRLVFFVSGSVGLVLLTGVPLVAMAKDHPEEHIWLRLVTILTVLLGIVGGSCRALLQKAPDSVPPETLAKLRSRLRLMTATTAAIIVLIAVKPG